MVVSEHTAFFWYVSLKLDEANIDMLTFLSEPRGVKQSVHPSLSYSEEVAEPRPPECRAPCSQKRGSAFWI